MSLPGAKMILEVESKFCGLAVPTLTATAGNPPFCALDLVGNTTFTDIYFDRQGKLASKGLWVRQRHYHEAGSRKWQAKYRFGGDFTNSQFEEITHPPIIAQHVERLTDRHAQGANFGLGIIAELTTFRKTWRADHDFTIVLDSMDFGHTVGEVELEEERAAPPDIDVQSWKSGVAALMDQRIQNFMNRYAWAFKVGQPEGKLTAYFRMHRASQG